MGRQVHLDDVCRQFADPRIKRRQRRLVQATELTVTHYVVQGAKMAQDVFDVRCSA
jgi:tRNA G46 methylase TrmB